MSRPVIGRLLKAHDYRLRTNRKELTGDFKNGGRTWGCRPEHVNAHDFEQDT